MFDEPLIGHVLKESTSETLVFQHASTHLVYGIVADDGLLSQVARGYIVQVVPCNEKGEVKILKILESVKNEYYLV